MQPNRKKPAACMWELVRANIWPFLGAMVSTIITARKADNSLFFMFLSSSKLFFPAKAVPFRLSFAKFVLRKVLFLRASTSDTRVPLCHFICLHHIIVLHFLQ